MARKSPPTVPPMPPVAPPVPAGIAPIVVPATPSPSPTDLVRVFNQSKRQFRHDAHLSAPKAFVTVPRSIAEFWLREYPKDFLAGDSALRTLDPTAAALSSSEAKRAALEAEKASLEAELASLRRQIGGERPAPVGPAD